MNAVGLIRFLAEPAMPVRFIIGIVAFEPHHLAVALEGQNMRGHSVQEPTIVRDHHRAAGEIQQRLLQGSERLDIEIVGWFIEE